MDYTKSTEESVNIEPANHVMNLPLDEIWQAGDYGDDGNQEKYLGSLFDNIIAKEHLDHTDASNAQEWASYQRGDYIYNHTSRQWMSWTGSHWNADLTGQVVETVKSFSAWIWDEVIARDLPPDDEVCKRMQKKTTKLGDINKINNCLQAATSIAGLVITEDALDQKPDLLNFANGTYDLDTHEFRQHCKTDYLTKALGFNYDASASAMPNFQAFMDTTFQGDDELQRFVWETMGTCCSGRILEPTLHFWYGGGCNGKSVLWNTLMSILKPYAVKINYSVLQDRTNPDRGQNEKARMKGMRLVFTSEVTKGSVLNEAMIKDITSNDLMEARHLRQRTFSFEPSHHVIMVGNNRPQINEASIATKRRLKITPFRNVIPEDQRIEEHVLRAGFVPEYPAIMNKLIESYQAVQANKGQFTRMPRSVQEYTESYWDDNDIMRAWMDENCRLDPTCTGTALGELYSSYNTWAEANNYRTVNSSRFTRMFKDYIASLPNISVYEGHARRKYVQGMGLDLNREEENCIG